MKKAIVSAVVLLSSTASANIVNISGAYETSDGMQARITESDDHSLYLRIERQSLNGRIYWDNPADFQLRAQNERSSGRRVISTTVEARGSFSWGNLKMHDCTITTVNMPNDPVPDPEDIVTGELDCSGIWHRQ